MRVRIAKQTGNGGGGGVVLTLIAPCSKSAENICGVHDIFMSHSSKYLRYTK